MCVDGWKEVLDGEDLAVMRVDSTHLRWEERPGEKKTLMLSENGNGNDRASDFGKEGIGDMLTMFAGTCAVVVEYK